MATAVAVWMGQSLLRHAQFVPRSVVFHAPPVAAVAYMIRGFVGSMAISFIRPPSLTPIGPSNRHNEPLAGGRFSRWTSARFITSATAAAGADHTRAGEMRINIPSMIRNEPAGT